MASSFGRRQFITLVGGAAAWLLTARAAAGDAGGRNQAMTVEQQVRTINNDKAHLGS